MTLIFKNSICRTITASLITVYTAIKRISFFCPNLVACINKFAQFPSLIGRLSCTFLDMKSQYLPGSQLSSVVVLCPRLTFVFQFKPACRLPALIYL